MRRIPRRAPETSVPYQTTAIARYKVSIARRIRAMRPLCEASGLDGDAAERPSDGPRSDRRLPRSGRRPTLILDESEHQAFFSRAPGKLSMSRTTVYQGRGMLRFLPEMFRALSSVDFVLSAFQRCLPRLLLFLFSARLPTIPGLTVERLKAPQART